MSHDLVLPFNDLLQLKGERTFGVLTKLDLMDKGTNALDVISLSLLSFVLLRDSSICKGQT